MSLFKENIMAKEEKTEKKEKTSTIETNEEMLARMKKRAEDRARK